PHRAPRRRPPGDRRRPRGVGSASTRSGRTSDTHSRDSEEETMRITLNGRPAEVPDGDLAALLRRHGAPDAGCPVARNGEEVPRAAHAGPRLLPDDVVEVVQAVQGG